MVRPSIGWRRSATNSTGSEFARRAPDQTRYARRIHHPVIPNQGEVREVRPWRQMGGRRPNWKEAPGSLDNWSARARCRVATDAHKRAQPLLSKSDCAPRPARKGSLTCQPGTSSIVTAEAGSLSRTHRECIQSFNLRAFGNISKTKAPNRWAAGNTVTAGLLLMR